MGRPGSLRMPRCSLHCSGGSMPPVTAPRRTRTRTAPSRPSVSGLAAIAGHAPALPGDQRDPVGEASVAPADPSPRDHLHGAVRGIHHRPDRADADVQHPGPIRVRRALRSVQVQRASRAPTVGAVRARGARRLGAEGERPRITKATIPPRERGVSRRARRDVRLCGSLPLRTAALLLTMVGTSWCRCRARCAAFTGTSQSRLSQTRPLRAALRPALA